MEIVNAFKYQLYIFLQQNEVTKIMRRRQHQKPEDNIYNTHRLYMYMCEDIYIYISFKKNEMEQKEESNKENSLKTQLFKIKEPT